MTQVTPAAGTIYVITDGIRMKVGWTTAPVETRLTHLQAGNPAELLVRAKVAADSSSDEYSIHQYLRDGGFWIRREWFEWHQPLIDAFDKFEHVSDVFAELAIKRAVPKTHSVRFDPTLITEKRLAAGFDSSTALGVAAGLGVNTVLYIEKGQNEPNTKTLSAICSVLGCHPGELFVVDPTPQPEPAE